MSGIGGKIGELIGGAIKQGNPVNVIKEGIEVAANTVDRFVNSPQERAEETANALDAMRSTNAIEAQHTSIFVAGWRPFIGWVCGSGLAFEWIAKPILNWFLLIINSLAKSNIPPLPSLEIEQILSLVVSLLGLAGYRTYEVIKGRQRNKI